MREFSFLKISKFSKTVCYKSQKHLINHLDKPALNVIKKIGTRFGHYKWIKSQFQINGHYIPSEINCNQIPSEINCNQNKYLIAINMEEK